jgi:tetratricopeptide (TPR) repeat protein
VYQVQARFALASIYDRAAARVEPRRRKRRRLSRGAANEQRAAARAARGLGDLAVRPRSRSREARRADGTIKDLERANVEVDTQATIVGSEAKAMESYRLFLDVASDDPVLRAEAMRRLADLQLETADAEELATNLQALGTLGSTIEMYSRLLKSYPNYAKNDLVLYQLARAYEAEGRIDESLGDARPAHRGVSAHDASRRAQFRRGETLFVQKRYRDAERAYRLRARRRRQLAVLRAIALQARLDAVQAAEYDDSMESFFTLLDRQLGTDNDASGDRDPAVLYAAMGRAQQELVDDTFRVLSIGFSYLDGPSRSRSISTATVRGRTRSSRTRTWATSISSKSAIKTPPRPITRSSSSTRITPKRRCSRSRSSRRSRKGSSPTSCSTGKENFVETYGPGSPYWQRFTFEQQPRSSRT